MAATPLKLIVGLGNPGSDYARTRHNAGFWFIDELARRHAGTLRREPRHDAEIGRVRIGAAEVWLMKPQSYMNLSGTPVESVAHFYKIASEEILVAYDELDLPPGAVRLKFGGGTAGHNGIQDVISHIGEACWRLRIGVGQPGLPRGGASFVLGRAPAQEEQLIRATIAEAADVIPLVLTEGAQKAMNRLHSRDSKDADDANTPGEP